MGIENDEYGLIECLACEEKCPIGCMVHHIAERSGQKSGGTHTSDVARLVASGFEGVIGLIGDLGVEKEKRRRVKARLLAGLSGGKKVMIIVGWKKTDGGRICGWHGTAFLTRTQSLATGSIEVGRRIVALINGSRPCKRRH